MSGVKYTVTVEFDDILKLAEFVDMVEGRRGRREETTYEMPKSPKQERPHFGPGSKEKRMTDASNTIVPFCKTHGESALSNSGALFCPNKMPDGSYCSWTDPYKPVL